MNRKPFQRPPLQWEDAGIFIDPNTPAGKVDTARVPACKLSIASAGYDHRKGIDRIKMSYKLGWLEKEAFRPIANIPDERAEEFIAALRAAMTEAHVAYHNGFKAVQGKLAVTMGEAAKG